MTKLKITTAVSVLLLTSGSIAFGGNTQAIQSSNMGYASGQASGGHESVEALKAEIASLQTNLQNTETGRAYLKTRLEEVLAESRATQANNLAMHEDKLQRALKGREFLSGQSKRNRTKLMAERKDNARLSLALERALRGRNYLSTKVDELESAAAENNTENARLELALERALRGRSYLSDKVVGLENEVQQIADISFQQINSAIAERDSAVNKLNSVEWADSLSAELTGSFENLDGTEVTSLGNNSVAIKVGNKGLFRQGGIALSEDGKRVLSQIGGKLTDHADSIITVVGHTDNIPTGSASRFSNNEELSLARATSALSYLASVGVPAERLSASGVGAAYPIASNDTDAGQTANRRVEILLRQAR